MLSNLLTVSSRTKHYTSFQLALSYVALVMSVLLIGTISVHVFILTITTLTQATNVVSGVNTVRELAFSHLLFLGIVTLHSLCFLNTEQTLCRAVYERQLTPVPW